MWHRLALAVCAIFHATPLAANGSGQEPPGLGVHAQPLPQHALLRIGTSRSRTSTKPQALAFTPDCRRLVSIDQATGVHVWDIAAGRELLAFGRTALKGAFGLSSDGSLAAIVESNDICRIHETKTGKAIQTLHAAWAEASKLCFSPDRKLLAAADQDMRLSLWDVSTGKLVRQWDDGAARDWRGPQIDFSPDGKTLAVDSGAGPIHFYDVGSGQRVELQGKAAGFSALAFSPHGKTLAAVDHISQDFTLWDVASKTVLHTLALNQARCWCVGFAPDGKTVASGNYHGKVFFWDVASGKLLRTMNDHPGEVEALAYSPDGKLLATSSGGCTVRVFEVASERQVCAFAGPHAVLNTARWTADGKQILSISRPWYSGSALRYWDASTGLALKQIEWDPEDKAATCLSADGKTIFYADAAGAIQTRRLDTGKDGPELTRPEWRTHTLDMSADGRYLVGLAVEVGDRAAVLTVRPGPPRSSIHVWDVASGKMLLSLTGNADEKYSCRFSDDARFLAVQRLSYTPSDNSRILLAGGELITPPGQLTDKAFALWDLQAGRKILRAPPHAIDFLGPLSPSGRCLASIDPSTGHAVVRELANGKTILRLQPEQERYRCAAFAAEGRVLFLGAHDGSIAIWDYMGGKQLARLTGHLGPVLALTLSPDGKRLLSAGDDTTLIVWDISQWQRRPAKNAKALAEDAAASLWADLSHEDAAKAYAAIGKMLQSPKQALAMLRVKLRPEKADQSADISQWIADLDRNSYAAREKAMASLQKLGILALPALEKAMASDPPLEVRLRIEILCSRLESQPFPRQWLQAQRALEALEMLGTPPAVELLETVSRGDPEAWLTQEAIATLERVRKRAKV